MEAWNISYIYTVIFMMLINNILVYVLSRTPGFGKSERWILQLLIAVCVCDLSDVFGILFKQTAGRNVLFILDAAFIFSVASISLFFLCYSENIYGSDMFKKRIPLITIHIPIDVLCIIIVASYRTEWIYKYPQILMIANIYNAYSILLSLWRIHKEKMQKKGILLNYGAELFMEKRKEGQKEYYITRQNVDGASWQMILIIPENEYEDQYRFLWLSAALMLGSMIAVIVLMSYLLSGYYVGRLKKLNVEMTGLESGNLNANLPITTEEDEIEEIYHNFNGMVQEVQRLMQEHYQLGKEVKMAEVRALQAQINPHFLYNTLDLINWISMDYGAEEIGTLTWNLARFYRLSLNHGKSLISIGEEVEHVEVYVNIENYHFDNAISLEVDVPEELKSYACLNIILQPFVENAIVHGIAEKPDIESCEIRIRARREEQDIIFSVQDDGPGVDVEQMQKETQQDIRTAQHGYGVRNINFRLKLCFGEKYGVTYLESEKGTHVEIKIPVMTIAEAEEKI